MSEKPDRYIDAKETMKRLGVSRGTIYNLIKRGVLTPRPTPSYLVHSHKQEFLESQVNSLLEGENNNPTEEDLPVAS